MGLFDFLKSKASSSDKPGKSELENQIRAIDTLKDIFQTSSFMRGLGAGRADKMAGVMASYKCIFVYFYDNVFHYGSAGQFLYAEDQVRYTLTSAALSSVGTRGRILSELPANWQDTLNTINLLENAESVRIGAIRHEVDSIERSIRFFSKS